MLNNKNLIIYIINIILLIIFIGAFSNIPSFLAIVSYCLGMITMKQIQKQD